MTQRIVDAHTHLFPPEIAVQRAAYLARDAWFNLCYENPQLLLAAPDDVIASMDAAEIQTSIATGKKFTAPSSDPDAYLRLDSL